MKRAYTWGAVGLVMIMGMAGPGCFLFGADDDEVRWEICASPIESRTHCVSSTSGPGASWEQAAANDTEAIEMWVERADGTPLDEWVSRPASVEGYLDVVQQVLDYLRVTQRNAESYHASLAGRLGRDLERATQLQEKMIAEKSVDPKTRIQQTLLDKGAKETDPLKAEITADKQTMGDVQAIFDAAKVDAGPFASQYKALVDDFVTYRATEATEITAYTTLATDASNATLAGLEGAATKSIGKITDFEKTAARYLVKQEGHQMHCFGDDAVRKVLGISMNDPVIPFRTSFDFLTITKTGGLALSEVKGVTTGKVDVRHALSQLENGMRKLGEKNFAASVERVQIIVPKGAILDNGYKHIEGKLMDKAKQFVPVKGRPDLIVQVVELAMEL